MAAAAFNDLFDAVDKLDISLFEETLGKIEGTKIPIDMQMYLKGAILFISSLEDRGMFLALLDSHNCGNIRSNTGSTTGGQTEPTIVPAEPTDEETQVKTPVEETIPRGKDEKVVCRAISSKDEKVVCRAISSKDEKVVCRAIGGKDDKAICRAISGEDEKAVFRAISGKDEKAVYRDAIGKDYSTDSGEHCPAPSLLPILTNRERRNTDNGYENVDTFVADQIRKQPVPGGDSTDLNANPPTTVEQQIIRIVTKLASQITEGGLALAPPPKLVELNQKLQEASKIVAEYTKDAKDSSFEAAVKRKLKESFTVISQHLQFADHRNFLFQCGVLQQREIQEIDGLPSEEEKISQLLYKLDRKHASVWAKPLLRSFQRTADAKMFVHKLCPDLSIEDIEYATEDRFEQVLETHTFFSAQLDLILL